MNKILLIGCGHMGNALLRTWVLNTNFSFFVIDPLQYKKINRNFSKGVKAFESINDIKNISSINLVILAVKPQIILSVMKDIKKNIWSKKTIFLSIIAGKKINFFNKYLSKNTQFIRAMPNMPAVIAQSMTCLFANKNVTKKNIKFINSFFLNVGKTMWLRNESDINKVTAISGSGPGYIFFIIDAFEKAAMQLDLTELETRNLVHQTLLGSINLLLQQKESASVLADNIAVKGGTTESGLKIFKSNKILHKTFMKVIKASYIRANELGK